MSDGKSKLLSRIAGKSRLDTTTTTTVQIRLPTSLPSKPVTVAPQSLKPVTPKIEQPVPVPPPQIMTPPQIVTPPQSQPQPLKPETPQIQLQTPKTPKRRRRVITPKKTSTITEFAVSGVDPFNDPTLLKPAPRKRARPTKNQNQKNIAEEVSDDEDYLSDTTLFLLEGPPPDPDRQLYGITFSVFDAFRCPESYLLSMSPMSWNTGIMSLGHIPEGLNKWKHPVYSHLQPYGFVYCIEMKEVHHGHIIIMITSTERTHANFYKSKPMYNVYHIIKKADLDREYGFASRDHHLARLRSEGLDFNIRARLADPHNNIIYLRLIGRYVSVRCIPEERAKMDSDIAKYPIPIDMQSFWAETNVITSDYVRRSLQEKHHIRPGVVKHFRLDM